MSYPTPPPAPAKQTDTGALVIGILVTIFCCIPFGIVSIVKAVQGDAAGAKKWGLIGAITGVVVIVLYVIASVTLFAASSSTSM
ncbi:CD225/dispanin family protein [Nocardioides sp. NPDC006273]|uniref:CD225/dispanin family protein n=1 Tax=Nocardioides sp. NPDC006273 TaxID=3155598 RepID=UPI0033AAC5FF